MAETFTGSIKVVVSASLDSSIDLGTRDYRAPYSKTYTFTNGDALNKANQIWTDTRTLTASSSENLDLAGSLVNAFNTTITFTKIKGILIVANEANVNNLLVGGHASAAFINWVADATDIVTVRPGGCLLLVAPDANGYAVTATTGDLLKIANSGSGTSVMYDVFVIGVM